ncbi:uncharacterized protein LOC141637942 [Silene latifolia]|uniref:uncharacterized protein LOC141637942 n=1 Tax=Silene latifolia TaxID=37657 RepID=UPI003D78736C
MKAAYTNGIWTGNSGDHTVTKGYKWLQGVQDKCDWFLWNNSNIPKHSFVGWMTVKGRMFTKDRMQGFGMPTNGLCEFCLVNQEDHAHLLYECVYSQKCGEGLTEWLGVTVPLHDLVQWSIRWRSKSLMKKQILLAAIIALWYHLWKARNICRIEAKLFTPRFIIQQVRYSAKVQREANDI